MTSQQPDLRQRIEQAINRGLNFAQADPDSVLPEATTAVLAVVEAEIADARNAALTEAAEIAGTVPVPTEAGPDWHWFGFGCNRAAEALLAARTTTN